MVLERSSFESLRLRFERFGEMVRLGLDFAAWSGFVDVEELLRQY